MDPGRTAALLARLRRRGHTVATAESLTGGLVCAELTSVAGSSAVVVGGVVAYATRVKHEVLGVDPALLRAGGAVEQDVSRQMAAGVRAALGASWGVATTGVAGPEPAEGKPAGTVFVAVATEGATQVRELRLPGARPAVRDGAVAAAIDLLDAVVGGPAGPGAGNPASGLSVEGGTVEGSTH